jgi:tellurite resistance protein
MAGKSDSVGVVFALLWVVGCIWFLWKALYYVVRGKKLGKRMFGKKMAVPLTVTGMQKTVVETNALKGVVSNQSNIGSTIMPSIQDENTFDIQSQAETSHRENIPVIKISFEAGATPSSTTPESNDYSFTLPKPEPTSTSINNTSSLQGKNLNEEVVVKSCKITGGLIYVGGNNASYEYRSEPSKINIYESIEPKEGELFVELGYFPNYGGLSANQKGAYIYWLSNGRNIPEVNIGYVFIYFYGLERRLLFDLKGLPEHKEEAFIIYSEIKRLLEIYNSNDSFSRYAGRLLNVANGIYGFEPYLQSSVRSVYDYEIPLSLKIELGRCAIEQKPLPLTLALSWMENTGYNGSRTPFQRCNEEFLILFISKYSSLYGDGIVYQKIPKREIRIDYQYCNYSLGGYFKQTIDGIPDVTTSSHVFSKLSDLFEKCIDELDAYSRFLGRNPGKENSLTALALLPAEVLLKSNNSIVQSVSTWLNSQFASTEMPVISKISLFNQLQLDKNVKITPKEWTGIVQFIGKFGIGIEVDPRYGNTKLDKISNFILFKLEDDAESVSTPEYTFASLFLQLGSYFGGSTQEERDSEKVHLLDWIHSQKAFSKTEKKRLSVYLAWLYVEKPEINSLKKKIQQLSKDQQEHFVTQLIIVAGIDGLIEPEEIKVLQQVYEWIGKDPAELFADLHNLESEGADTKARKPTAKKATTELSTPAVGGIVLDQRKISKKLKETKAVNSILSDVFAEEEVSPVHSVTKKPKGKTIGNLDEVHSSLLLELLKKTIWTRGEFEALCEAKSLFADGAMEMINECAYSIANEPLIEDDEPMTIDLAVAEQLKAK